MPKERALHVVTDDEAAGAEPQASADLARLTAIADELYALPVEQFTKARDAAAKAAGADAATIRSWRRPSASAGLVNLLVRERRDQVGELLGLGAAMRDAQAALDGDALRELTRQRTQVVQALAEQARQLAAARGHKVGDGVVREVETSLSAALSDEQASAAVRTGRLVRAISADGFGNADLTDAVTLPTGTGQELTVRAPERPARADEGGRAKQERAALEKAARDARADAIRAEEDLAATELAVADADARLTTAQSRVAELETALDEARVELREATADERSARQLREAARKAAAQAQHRAKFAEAAVHD